MKALGHSQWEAPVVWTWVTVPPFCGFKHLVLWLLPAPPAQGV